MDNCTEYQELISAYADGELSGHDKMRVEAHLRLCAHCSSALETYRVISAAVNESCAPAPDSLRAGVMEQLASADTPRTAADMKNYKLVKTILTRYAPVAACLALLLLTVPRFFGSGGPFNEPNFDAAPMMSAPMPVAAPAAPAPMPAGEADYGDSFDYAVEAEFEISVMDDGWSSSADMPPASSVPEESATPTEPPDRPDQSVMAGGGADYNESANGNRTPPAEPAASPADPADAGAGAGYPAAEVETGGYLSGVYAIIEIIGELPEFLKEYGEEFAAHAGDMPFEMPRAEAEALIREIDGNEGVKVEIADENGAYVWIYYTPGD